MSLSIYTNYTWWADFKENLHSRSKLSWLNPGILIDNVGWGLSSYFKLDVSHDNSGELAIGVVDIFWEDTLLKIWKKQTIVKHFDHNILLVDEMYQRQKHMGKFKIKIKSIEH